MNDTAGSKDKLTPEVRHAIITWILQAFAGLVAYGGALLLAAGRLDWGWGWLLLGLVAAALACHVLLLVPTNPELLAERARGIWAAGTKDWDRWLATISGGVLPIVSWIVAGLELRLGWSGGMPLALHLGGLVCSLLGWVLFLWAMVSNAFFVEGVRIQQGRDHVVATGGPYRWVRHPGYAGAGLYLLATPFLLGSWWAVLPAGLAAGGYVLRTALEDATLLRELGGYAQYAQRVRHRLIPSVW